MDVSHRFSLLRLHTIFEEILELHACVCCWSQFGDVGLASKADAKSGWRPNGLLPHANHA